MPSPSSPPPDLLTTLPLSHSPTLPPTLSNSSEWPTHWPTDGPPDPFQLLRGQRPTDPAHSPIPELSASSNSNSSSVPRHAPGSGPIRPIQMHLPGRGWESSARRGGWRWDAAWRRGGLGGRDREIERSRDRGFGPTPSRIGAIEALGRPPPELERLRLWALPPLPPLPIRCLPNRSGGILPILSAPSLRTGLPIPSDDSYLVAGAIHSILSPPPPSPATGRPSDATDRSIQALRAQGRWVRLSPAGSSRLHSRCDIPPGLPIEKRDWDPVERITAKLSWARSPEPIDP
jgi:hypothetical protein